MDDYRPVGGDTLQQDEPPHKWHQLGSPRKLLEAAGHQSSAQFAALFLLLMNCSVKNQFVMPCCNEHLPLGAVEVAFCEYTRVYVLCFPILGIVVALIATARMILQRRMYYEMLRLRAGLLVFERGVPMKDPSLLVLAWCMAHAFLHLLHKVLVYSNRSGVTATMAAAYSNATGVHTKVDFSTVMSSLESEKPTMFRLYKDFALPTVLFLVFLKKSYSIDDSLVSLQSYISDDPERARQTLDSLDFIPERSVAAAAQSGLRLDNGYTEKAALLELVNRARGNVEQERVRDGPVKSQLLSQLWPGKVLLDRRLQDRDSSSFRRAWLVFIWPAYVLVAICMVLFVYRILIVLSHLFGMPVITLQEVAISGGVHVMHEVHCTLDMSFSFFLGLLVLVAHLLVTVWLVRRLQAETRPPGAAASARLEAVPDVRPGRNQSPGAGVQMVQLPTPHMVAAAQAGTRPQATTEPQAEAQEILLNDWRGLTATAQGGGIGSSW